MIDNSSSHGTSQHRVQIVNDVSRAKQAIENAHRLLILISGPDEDSIGAGIVLKRYLQRQGKTTRLVSANSLQSYYRIPLVHEIEVDDPALMTFLNYDLIVTVDTANPYPQLVDQNLHSSFEFSSAPPVLSIDHHLGNSGFANHNIWEPRSSSVCEMVYKHFLAGMDLLKDESTLLLLGISYDTGHLRWKTTAETLSVISDLVGMGADLDFVVERQYFSYSVTTLHLISKWLDSMVYQSKLGYMAVSVSLQEMAEQGIHDAEVDSARDVFTKSFLRAVPGYPVGIFLISDHQVVRGYIVGNNVANKINLTELSLMIGGNGGGHFNSVSFTVIASITEVWRKIDNALEVMSRIDRSR